MKVTSGQKVKVEYTGKFKDGTVFDSSDKHGQPLEFEVGAHQVIKGFEEGMIGMEVGESKTLNIPAKEAYGDRNDQLTRKIPKEQLPKDQAPEQGMMIMMKTPDGQQIPATIAEVSDKDVTIDFNHPLAGKDLIFDIKLIEAK